MTEKAYSPHSSDSDSDDVPSTRVLRPQSSQTASQSIDVGESSQPITPSCETSFSSFHFAAPKSIGRQKYGKRKVKFHGNKWSKKQQFSAPSIQQFSTPSVQQFSTPSDIEQPESESTMHLLSKAARKLNFKAPEKPQSLDLSFYLEESELQDISARPPRGNCLINFEVLQSMFDCMLCGQCSSCGYANSGLWCALRMCSICSTSVFEL